MPSNVDQLKGGHVRRLAVWGGLAVLVLGPLAVMLALGELAWDPGDFVFAGVLIVLVGVAYEIATTIRGPAAYWAGLGLAVATALLLVWINLAVGIVGSEDNPANLIYGGVLAVGLVGALIARFRPGGMARALAATAIAQAAAFVAALVAGVGFTGPITVFFGALWLISAWLLQKASRERGRPAAA